MMDIQELIEKLMKPAEPECAFQIKKWLQEIDTGALEAEQHSLKVRLEADAALLAGRPAEAVDIIESYVQQANLTEAEHLVWSIIVFLPDAPASNETHQLVRIARHASNVLSKGLFLFKLLKREDVPTQKLDRESDVRDILKDFYGETGMVPLKDGLDGFRALFSVFHGDRDTIDQCIGEGSMPEPSDLECAYWREKIIWAAPADAGSAAIGSQAFEGREAAWILLPVRKSRFAKRTCGGNDGYAGGPHRPHYQR